MPNPFHRQSDTLWRHRWHESDIDLIKSDWLNESFGAEGIFNTLVNENGNVLVWDGKKISVHYNLYPNVFEF